MLTCCTPPPMKSRKTWKALRRNTRSTRKILRGTSCLTGTHLHQVKRILKEEFLFKYICREDCGVQSNTVGEDPSEHCNLRCGGKIRQVCLPLQWILFSKRKFSRVNLESALGVIGGTMGLFTGFSVLSAVEIVYYALKYLSSSSSSPTASKISKSLKHLLK